MSGLVFKLFKFGIVGFSGLIVDFLLTFLCKEKLRLNKYVANTIGFSCAATSNFMLNRVWTFHSGEPAVYTQYGKFVLIAIVGLLINSLIIYLLVNYKQLNFYIAKFIAIVVVMTWNFSLNYLYTFRN
ncbi:MAG TPA: GtrA family protein [Flavipsychrobacter sp.]|nr:GtrA family protein [Flavipsychrobacter sp.]